MDSKFEIGDEIVITEGPNKGQKGIIDTVFTSMFKGIMYDVIFPNGDSYWYTETELFPEDEEAN